MNLNGFPEPDPNLAGIPCVEAFHVMKEVKDQCQQEQKRMMNMGAPWDFLGALERISQVAGHTYNTVVHNQNMTRTFLPQTYQTEPNPAPAVPQTYGLQRTSSASTIAYGVADQELKLPAFMTTAAPTHSPTQLPLPARQIPPPPPFATPRQVQQQANPPYQTASAASRRRHFVRNSASSAALAPHTARQVQAEMPIHHQEEQRPDSVPFKANVPDHAEQGRLLVTSSAQQMDTQDGEEDDISVGNYLDRHIDDEDLAAEPRGIEVKEECAPEPPGPVEPARSGYHISSVQHVNTSLYDSKLIYERCWKQRRARVAKGETGYLPGPPQPPGPKEYETHFFEARIEKINGNDIHVVYKGGPRTFNKKDIYVFPKEFVQSFFKRDFPPPISGHV